MSISVDPTWKRMKRSGFDQGPELVGAVGLVDLHSFRLFRAYAPALSTCTGASEGTFWRILKRNGGLQAS